MDKPKLSLITSVPPAPEDVLRLDHPFHEPRTRNRESTSTAASLVRLRHLFGDERRTTFRQIITALAAASEEDGPGPLEGTRGELLRPSVLAAIEGGLCDDLDWIDRGSGGAALFQLALALPVGHEQRELGRRVLARLLDGNAQTFVKIATSVARAGGKAMFLPAARARLALVTELPLSLEAGDGPLAFAIASRKSLAKHYVVLPATRSLPERRLAARLIERASAEAMRRAQLGDRSGLRLVGPEGPLGPTWAALLADREPLVWRHVAIARGLLLGLADDRAVTAFGLEFGARLTPTEWRRASATLGGLAVAKPFEAEALLRRALSAGLLTRDPGAIGPLVSGLTRAAETDPERATELLATILDHADPPRTADELAEAAVLVRKELGDTPFTEGVLSRAREHLGRVTRPPQVDDGAIAKAAELARAVRSDHVSEGLTASLDRALLAYFEGGARVARAEGLAVLEAARGAVDTLVAIGEIPGSGKASALARRTGFSAVRELDAGLFEGDVLQNLLRLDTREAVVKQSEATLEDLRSRAFQWIVERELVPRQGPTPELEHPTLHLTRLRALLHLVDGDSVARSEDGESPALGRFRTSARALELCFHGQIPRALRRAMIATLARSLDAIVRVGGSDVSDVLLVASSILTDQADVETLAEASMDPDTRDLVSSLAAVIEGKPRRVSIGGALDADSSPPADPGDRLELLALDALAEQLTEVGTARSDGLRAVLTRISLGLGSIARAKSITEIAKGGTGHGVVEMLEQAYFHLAQLHAGARARILDREQGDVAWVRSRALSSACERALTLREPIDPGAAERSATAISDGVSEPFRVLAHGALSVLPGLPLVFVETDPPERREAQVELPPWIPPRRRLGAFFVERSLAAGGVGSVFVVTRADDRFDPNAERFALKVPDYNANAARTLSEAEFLAIFRGEASALMSIPSQENLARFVTFDLAARPKPILVMELVEGPNLERLIDGRTLEMSSAIRAVDQVALGLTAMHGVGVGHLDLKPANVVLRDGRTAVLVDFGLAGRSIRPGCGSAPYAPPEVWTYQTEASPMAADVYSFACLAFETLTGQLLFEGDNEMQMVAQHLAHDGTPDRLARLAAWPHTKQVASVLSTALRRDPAMRCTIGELRVRLGEALAPLASSVWPLPL